MQSRKVSLTVAFDALHVFIESCVIRGEKSDLMENYIQIIFDVDVHVCVDDVGLRWVRESITFLFKYTDH